MSDYIVQHEMNMKFNMSSSWIIYNEKTKKIIDKISNGKPLKEWDIQINRGILTGYNDAFIIDTKTKDLLIKQDPNSAKIIRPILRGKDINRYNFNFHDMWLLYIPWHFPLHNNSSISGASSIAENEFKKQYPVVYNYLLQFKDKLLKRNKAETGIRYEWYALQRWGAKYTDDFYKKKIIYPNMTKYLPFYLDEENYFVNQKCFIITGEHLGYLTAFLNSNIFKFCYRDEFPELQGGTRELSKIFFEKIKVKEVSDEINSLFENYVHKIENLKHNNQDATKLEEKVEKLLYDIYDLNEKEKKYISSFSF